MKSTSLLPVCAMSVLARDLASHQDTGFCYSPSSASFPLLSNPICSHDTLRTKYVEASTSSPLGKAWGPVSSCYQNETEEYCVFTSKTFADGRGISIITTPERAEYIAGLPAFTNPNATKGFNQDLEADVPKKYKLVHVPGKDVGVVATQPINRGDHIMSNTASIMIDYGVFDHLPAHELLRRQAEGIDNLPHLHRSRFMNLSTHSNAEDHLDRIDKILNTNSFDIDFPDKRKRSLYVVFPEIARFNHDCRPNADYYFDAETLSQHIHANRPIAVGEEISVTYIDPFRTRDRRVKKLHSVWGFQCGCSQCTQRRAMVDASDDRIEQIVELRKQLEDYSAESAATPQMAELVLSLYEQERLHSLIYEAYTYAAIEWNGVGEPWTAVKYARLAIEYGLISAGPSDRDVLDMEALAEDPWDHWSWMLRTKKRMSWGRMRPIRETYMRGGGYQEEEE